MGLLRRLDPEADRRLVDQCRRGNARAWESLVRRHERLVYAVARSYRLPEGDLADVFQEVFAALVKGLPRLRDGRTLVRWLSVTTDRIAYAAALRARRRDAVTPSTDPHVLSAAADDAPGFEARLQALEQQALVRMALESLSERCRNLLEALYYEDPTPSYRSLATRFKISIGSLGPTRARCFDGMRRALLKIESDADTRISRHARATFVNEDETWRGTRSTRRPREKRRRRDQGRITE